MNVQERPSAGKTAGIFVDRSGSKPLPLSGNRYVVPNLTFFKKTHSRNADATVLRRTGDNSAFSDQGKDLSSDEETQLPPSKSQNMTNTQGQERIMESRQPRRGRRTQRDNKICEGNKESGGSSRRHISAARSWSPPRSFPRQHPTDTMSPALPRRNTAPDEEFETYAALQTRTESSKSEQATFHGPVVDNNVQCDGSSDATTSETSVILPPIPNASRQCHPMPNDNHPSSIVLTNLVTLQILNKPKFGHDWEGGTLV
jgi:hypothetical protein